jgi:hypothetical protein
MTSLLSEGASSYLHARTAIEAFEEEAFKFCKKVYEQYRRRLVSTTGLKDEAPEDFDNIEPADGYAELGVKMSGRSEREWFYVFIMWRIAGNGACEILACASLDFRRKNDRDEYSRLLRKIPSIEPAHDNGYYYLQSQMELGDPSTWLETFSRLIDEWLACWPAGRRLK